MCAGLIPHKEAGGSGGEAGTKPSWYLKKLEQSPAGKLLPGPLGCVSSRSICWSHLFNEKS